VPNAHREYCGRRHFIAFAPVYVGFSSPSKQLLFFFGCIEVSVRNWITSLSWFFQRKNLNCTKFLPFCSFPFGAIQTLCHTHLHRTLETYFKLVPKQLCVEPPPSAHNMTRSAFAAERRTSPTPQMCTELVATATSLEGSKNYCGQS